ncbi:hypothetical protein E3T55_20085 [Cryobacterium frigoriphilum]|uniref:Peptidase inhibitor family I36 protein n=1 Tax=Cryobacterium frigoriphilum TaxID=1259150 RepID=A0A4R8ZT71_9MICO|nr:hypothetical protein [Cryobacterium frigoriphilum]TFD44738.1 hypothetical protein E3T55_20085 [Cryobacterium frigoriphilum]
MGKLGKQTTIAVIVAASVLSFGPVSSALAQPTVPAIDVHCAAEATPLNEPTMQSEPVCFGTEAEAEAYIESIQQPQNPAARSASASTILGTVYQDTNRSGSSLTLWGSNGCAGSVFGFSSLESGWTNTISSASGENGCWLTLYTAVSYGGSRLNCTPYCASIGSWNDNVKSLVFRPSGTFG